MKRKFVTAVVCSVFLFGFGCKAIPDGDDFDRLTDKIAGIPIEARLALDRWAANRVAYGYLLHYRDDNTWLGTLRCDTFKKGTQFYEVSVNSVMMCLNRVQTATYAECLKLVVEEIEEENADDGYACLWESFTKSDLNPKSTPSEFDAERHSDETLAEILIGPYMPPIEIQLMLMRVPGMVGPRGALCPQGVDWACAELPLDGEPNPTTSAASGGGDR